MSLRNKTFYFVQNLLMTLNCVWEISRQALNGGKL